MIKLNYPLVEATFEECFQQAKKDAPEAFMILTFNGQKRSSWQILSNVRETSDIKKIFEHFSKQEITG